MTARCRPVSARFTSTSTMGSTQTLNSDVRGTASEYRLPPSDLIISGSSCRDEQGTCWLWQWCEAPALAHLRDKERLEEADRLLGQAVAAHLIVLLDGQGHVLMKAQIIATILGKARKYEV